MEKELNAIRSSVTTLLQSFTSNSSVCQDIRDGHEKVSAHIQQLQQKNQELFELNSTLKNDLDRKQEENMNLNAVIKEKEEKIVGSENKIKELEQQLKNTTPNIDEINLNSNVKDNTSDVVKNVENDYPKLEGIQSI